MEASRSALNSVRRNTMYTANAPTKFLAPATYVKHDSELPMAVTWRLEHSLPGDLFAQFAAAVA
jgi:hypothetical protein